MNTIANLLETLDKKFDQTWDWEGLLAACWLPNDYNNPPSEYWEDAYPLQIFYHQDASWICTDERAGLTFVFLHDEFIGVASRIGRKYDLEYEWKDQESFEKVRAFLVEELNKNTEARVAKPLDMDFDCSSWVERALD